MPLLGTCRPSERKAAAPKPRSKQPRPVTTGDLVEDHHAIGLPRRFGRTIPEIMDKFMAKVFKNEDGCWIWMGAINKSRGYGVASFGADKAFLAHRVSYVLFVGDIPLGQLVLHRCDVRLCVNPEHFFLGTDADNARDSMVKLRKPSKLNADIVREARRLYFQDGKSQRAIADMFGVTQSNMSHVLSGKTWAHIK